VPQEKRARGPHGAGRADALIAVALRHFVSVTGLLAVVAYASVYTCQLADAPIRSDGYSYYVYLPSWLLHHDATLQSIADDCCGGTFPEFAGVRRWPETGRWVNVHPIGVAIQMVPFFTAAHLLTRWSNLPPDGFSPYYQYAAGLAGLCAMLAGLAVLRALLSRHFPDRIVLATLVTITWGTNLFHYGVYDATFSHAFSFFLIAALVALTERWWQAATRTTSFWLAIVAALIVLTRHPNAVFLFVVPLYGVTTVRALRRNAAMLVERRWVVTGMVAVCAACLLPQVAIYKAQTGHWFVSTYAQFGAFSFMAPHLWGVLFGVSKGLFFWSPVLLLAVAGAVVSKGWTPQVCAAAMLIFALDTWLIASWSDWQFGGSYGHRGFTDGLALAAILLAGFFEWSEARPRLSALVRVVTALAVVLSIAQMIQYWLRIIPFADTTWAQYRELFLRFR